MAEAEVGPPVMEGFICPMCKADFGNAVWLLNHFQEAHYEEQDLVKTFKDLLDKAKKKILKMQETSPEHSVQSRRAPGFEVHSYEKQEIGSSFSHTKMFVTIRNDRIQSLSVPQNQLIIRLEKLLENMPVDPIKKKAHEQNVVHWIDGTTVTRCPNCAGSFHLARRQHHCRTCGSIMCSDCSRYVTIHTARRILNKPPGDSVSNQNSGDNQLRLCVYCINILERTEQLKESQNKKPIISQFYEKLADYRRQADGHYSFYIKMCESLNAGEATYNLQNAQALKVKLLKLAENIESISGRLAELGTKDPAGPPQGQALRLQNAVRSAATGYLRNHLLNLPLLPTEEQLQELQEKRRREITARINEEKLNQARLQQNHNASNSRTSPLPKPSASTDQPVSKGQGWVPEKKKVNESDDPLIEQMNIIRSYIKEAQAAQKFDEVGSLEQNLKDLRKEFWRRVQVQDDASRSGESSEAGSLSSFDESRAHGNSQKEMNY